MKISKIKGFADLYGAESDRFTFMENQARKIFAACGFTELRTPILEQTELFKRSIGEETDVVNKEMYSLTTEKGRSYSLRPEATAGVMRAYIENSLYSKNQICRLFTTGPMFRHERPQKGRLRQFHQINCECLGSESPLADADMITMLMRYLHTLGLENIRLEINSLGCSACRPHFRQALQDFLAALDADCLCEDCQRRRSVNPLRVLDCKREACKTVIENAPRISDYLCADCKRHFSMVMDLLEQQQVSAIVNPKLVRGLDYYCRTTFEVVSGEIGAQSAIAGGGRYDGLISALGGPDIPGIGFACGMERLALLLPDMQPVSPDFYLLIMEEKDFSKGFRLLQSLRAQGLKGEMNYTCQSFKSLLRQADKSQAAFCLIIGTEESLNNSVTLKSMRDGNQQSIQINDIVFYLCEKCLKSNR
ncbi:MAG: histidine--tRNA ligase [Desulfovibrio sp.]|nr:histidine--tRNA ligase [Desulfovibrio sp.]